MNVTVDRGTGVYRFGEFLVDAPERRFSQAGRALRLPPKTFDVLVVLVERANRLVSKRELLERVWPDVFVAEGILTVHVAHLRKTLGDVKRTPRFIETVAGYGYRFVACVHTAEEAHGGAWQTVEPSRQRTAATGAA